MIPYLPKFILKLSNLISIVSLPRKDRRIVFYSEGRNYWVHLEALIKEFLSQSNVPVVYISSNGDDPGLKYCHVRYKSYEIDEGFGRDWLFANLDTDVMVMTMPDLHQYQVKRSKFDVHYVYTQHSLVSLQMVYRKGAFDYFDTVFCSGPHHVSEMRLIEKVGNLSKKLLPEIGYPRLDAILNQAQENKSKRNSDDSDSLHILIAPSWGDQGTIESGVGEKIVDQLLERKYRVTLRPHPQTIKFHWDRVEAIVRKHTQNPRFDYEDNVVGQGSLHSSDMMISDWSGAALDYAFGLKKPVMFIDVPRKINNSEYRKVILEPIEADIRDKIGIIVPLDFRILPIAECLQVDIDDVDIEAFVYNAGKSHISGARYLGDLLADV